MKIRPLSIEGAWEITPQLHGDARGLFTESYRFDHLAREIGHPMNIAQGNISVSARGVVRGVHFADVPPSQAKYVSCVHGAVLDVVVDLRVGSPTFGKWEGVRLDDVDRRSLYISEGLGHGFCALTEGATVSYMCSATFAPTRERSVHALDKDLGIDWSVDVPQLSDRDASAPTLAEVMADGLLPDYEACLAFRKSLTQA